MTAPKVFGGHGRFRLADQMVVDLLQPFWWQLSTGLTVGAVFIGWNVAMQQTAEVLSLADGFAAGTARLGDLPQERPENQAQIPAAVAGMGVILLLGEAMSGDKDSEESLELVDSGAAGGAQAFELSGKASGPQREVRCHIDSAYTVLLTSMLDYLHAKSVERLARRLSAAAAAVSPDGLDCAGQPVGTQATRPRGTALSMVAASGTQNGDRGAQCRAI